MPGINGVIHHTWSPVLGPVVRTLSYPHTQKGSVDHLYYRDDRGSPFAPLTGLDKFAMGTLDYSAWHQWCYWPFLLASSGLSFWNKLEDSTASCFWPGMFFFIANLSYASFSSFW